MIVICPYCGIESNTYPDYFDKEGTAVKQRLCACGHPASKDGITVYVVESQRYKSPCRKEK